MRQTPYLTDSERWNLAKEEFGESVKELGQEEMWAMCFLGYFLRTYCALAPAFQQ